MKRFVLFFIMILSLHSYASTYDLLDKAIYEEDIGQMEKIIAEGLIPSQEHIHMALFYKKTGPLKILLEHCSEEEALLRCIAQPSYVKMLLEAGACCDAVNSNNSTALSYALYRRCGESAEVLIEAKADLNSRDKFQSTPLHVAAVKGSDVLVSLIQAKGDINATRLNGETPLLCAASNGHYDSVAELIEAKADINAVDQERMTSLTYAIQELYPDIVAQLLEAGAIIDSRVLAQAKEYISAKVADEEDSFAQFMKSPHLPQGVLDRRKGLHEKVSSKCSKIIELLETWAVQQ